MAEVDPAVQRDGRELIVDLREIGAHGAQLVEREDDWIHRRVESLTIGPSLLVRRRLSIDFTVPPDTYPASAGEDDRPVSYLPVSFLRKWPPLSSLDLVDEWDRPLPLLTRVQNAVADAAALAEVARRELQLKGQVLQGPLEADVQLIATAARAEARAALRSIVQPSPPRQLDEVEQRARRTLAESLVFLSVASQLVDSTLLWIPVRCEPRRRRIIKMEYEVSTPNRLNLLRTYLTQFGWGAQIYWVETPHVGNAASYHLNISTPPYLEILDAALELEPNAGTDPPAPDVQIERHLAHIYLSGTRMNTLSFAWVSLRVERQGFLASAFFVSVCIASMLGLFSLWTTEMVQPDHLEPTVLSS